MGIKYQLRIATVVPVFLVALLFAFFYNGQFNRDLNQHISNLGEAYIHQLLPVAQLAILRDDNRTLQGLIDASTATPEVQSLAFYNSKRQLLAYRGGKHPLNQLFTPPEYTGDYIESTKINAYTMNFVAPITLPKYNLYAITPKWMPTSPIAFQADDILGWLSIDIDTKSMLVQRYQMYITTIFITFLGLLMSLSIHYWLSRRIYLPIARLRRSMKQILSNEFETQIKVSSRGELGVIESGCSHLQKKYLDTIQDLNQHIEVATADLQQSLELLEEKNIDLSLDKKKTEEKSRQKAELIANMSHEIRTPMNGVIGFTNVLLDSKLDPLQLDYVKTIKSSAQNLLAIISDILDYSKMDAGKLQLDCIPLDIRACIDEVLTLIGPIAKEKGIDLIPATAIDVPKMVLGDPLRIKQMITNLVSNAVKFTEHGYVLIRTNIEQDSEKDYAISIAITDTGIGISPEDQGILFNAFHQADTSITRRYGGSGLGLVICKNLAEHMRGRMSLTSELYKGSTFTIHIKLNKLASYEAEKQNVHRFSNLKVICFDENPLHLEALCTGLGYWGIHCLRMDAFNQLEQALAQADDYQLAFIGINTSMHKQVSDLLSRTSMPCVLVSTTPIQNYEALGAQGFLYKPPTMEKLYDTIDSLLKKVALTKNQHIELEQLRNQLRLAQPQLLVAEDNPVNRMLLNSMLSDKAMIETVNDGKQAVAICHHKHFNVILLDLQMPILNGLEAASLIHQESVLNRKTPIILISANGSDVSKEQLANAGIDICLQKPIDEETLLRYLMQLINKTKIPAIDWSLCVKKMSGNEALAKDFLDEFIHELKINRQEFVQLKQDKQIEGGERAAHKLLGACCFCGVPTLQSHVAHMETIAKHAKDPEELTMPFEQLIRAIDDVLDDYLEKLCQ